MRSVLAFLQNPWFKPGTNPEIIERYREDADFRRKILAMSATGRALRDAFGPLYQKIIWDNASYESGESREHMAKPDFLYMARRVALVRPDVILLFGGQAQLGWDRVCSMPDFSGLACRRVVLRAPHPMARGSYKEHLSAISTEVRRLCQ